MNAARLGVVGTREGLLGDSGALACCGAECCKWKRRKPQVSLPEPRKRGTPYVASVLGSAGWGVGEDGGEHV